MTAAAARLACANDDHDHDHTDENEPERPSGACNGCAQPCHYDGAVDDFVHDDPDAAPCFLIPKRPQGASPCLTGMTAEGRDIAISELRTALCDVGIGCMDPVVWYRHRGRIEGLLRDADLPALPPEFYAGREDVHDVAVGLLTGGERIEFTTPSGRSEGIVRGPAEEDDDGVVWLPVTYPDGREMDLRCADRNRYVLVIGGAP